MEYIYAALILNETDAEINEENLTAVLDAAGVDVEESRVKALVAALEDVDIEDAIEQAAAVPAAGGAAAPAEGGDDSDDDSDDDAAAAADDGDDDEEEEDEEASGEGLGSLFG